MCRGPVKYPVIPSIDISQGQAVKRVRGVPGTELVKLDVDQVLATILSRAPPVVRVHIVDLDGAKLGYPANFSLIRKIIRECTDRGVEIQVGGGIRDVKTAEEVYSAGAYPVIGSIVYTNPDVAAQIIDRVGSINVYVALDTCEGRIAIHGWSEKVTLDDPVTHLARLGVKNVIYTVVDVEGTLQGPKYDPDLLSKLRRELNLVDLIYAGGVRGREDIRNLVKAGFTGVIVGRAMYEVGLDNLLI